MDADIIPLDQLRHAVITLQRCTASTGVRPQLEQLDDALATLANHAHHLPHHLHSIVERILHADTPEAVAGAVAELADRLHATARPPCEPREVTRRSARTGRQLVLFD